MKHFTKPKFEGIRSEYLTTPYSGKIRLSDKNILAWYQENLWLCSPVDKLIATLKGHTNYVRGAIELSDGNLLSRNWNNTLHLWATEGEPLVVLEGHTDWVDGAIELADGRLLKWSDDYKLHL